MLTHTAAAWSADAAMSPDGVASVTTYVVHGQDLGPVRAARDEGLSGPRAASTVVPALARPE